MEVKLNPQPSEMEPLASAVLFKKGRHYFLSLIP